jgi:lysophospholipase L1-like esterase
MNINPIDIGWSMYERQNLIPNYVAGVHKYLFFAYGTNDCRTPLVAPIDMFESTYNEVIAHAKSKGWPASKIKIINIYNYVYDDVSFNNRLQSVSSYNDVQLLDIRSILASNPALYMADSIHPNDAGHAAMANYINSNITL